MYISICINYTIRGQGDKNKEVQFEDEYLNEKGEIVKGIQISKKEMGNAIKYLKSKFPQADGKLISGIIKGILKWKHILEW